MVIYSDSLIQLDYDSKTDVLRIKWPHLVDEPMLIVAPTIARILDAIKHFYVSKLLIDTKDTDSNIPEGDFQILKQEFVSALAASKVKKLARLIYAEPERELRARIITDELIKNLGSKFRMQEFTDEKSALAWLESDEL